MAMQPPQGPHDIFRTTTMASAVMMARDREKARSGLDERERDRLEQEQIDQEYERTKNPRGLFRRFLDRLPFG